MESQTSTGLPAIAINPYEMLVDCISDYAIYLMDPQGSLTTWNSGAQRAKGFEKSEIVGRHFSCFYCEEDRIAGLPQQNLNIAGTTGKYEGEGWRERKNGSRFWAHVMIYRLRGDQGVITGYAKITHDLTERHDAKMALLQAKRNLDTALSNMSQGLCLFDPLGKLVLANEAFIKLTGFGDAVPAPGVSARTLLRQILRRAQPSARNDRARLLEHLRHEMEFGGARIESETRYLDRIISVSTHRLEHGGWLTTTEDITERRTSELRIEYHARHDSLTGLSNRFNFQDQLNRLLAGPGQPPCFALLYLDLDHFKAVNDNRGHQVGDQLLKQVTSRLGAVLPERRQLARLGGDEFTILLPGSYLQDAEIVAKNCIEQLMEPFCIAGQEVSIGVSIGIVASSTTASNMDHILHQADQAMYEAKRKGRNRYCVYSPGMAEKQQWRPAAMEGDLRKALENGQLQLHYQPILSAHTGETSAFEALLRWTHPTRGAISPADFIPVAERCDLMIPLGNWVLRKACADACGWPEHIRLNVNVSTVQIMAHDFPEILSNALEFSGLKPARLELEITETARLAEIAISYVNVQKVRDMGIGLAMDDFGIGHSSLSLLQNLPFTRIKLDKTFVQNLGANPKAVAIVRSTVQLCVALGIKMIAEGVETEYQQELLRSAQCGELQGWLFERAIPCCELRYWLDFTSPALQKMFWAS